MMKIICFYLKLVLLGFPYIGPWLLLVFFIQYHHLSLEEKEDVDFLGQIAPLNCSELLKLNTSLSPKADFKRKLLLICTLSLHILFIID